MARTLAPDVRALLKEDVLFHAADLIARGLEPTPCALHRRLPVASCTTLRDLRDELRGEGRLVWRPGTAWGWLEWLVDPEPVEPPAAVQSRLRRRIAAVKAASQETARGRRRNRTVHARYDDRSVEELAAGARMYRDPFPGED